MTGEGPWTVLYRGVLVTRGMTRTYQLAYFVLSGTPIVLRAAATATLGRSELRVADASKVPRAEPAPILLSDQHLSCYGDHHHSERPPTVGEPSMTFTRAKTHRQKML